MWIRVALFACALGACGDDGGGGGGNADASVGGPDAFVQQDAPPTTTVEVTVSGTASERNAQGGGVLADVKIEAFRNANEGMPIATTMTDGFGNYSLTIQTMGESIDGYLKASRAGFLDTYLFPPYPLMMDFSEATVIMVTEQTYDALSTLTQANQDPTKAVIGLVVTDGMTPVAGATVTSNPASMPDARYNQMVGNVVLPTTQATSTYTDGVAYLFNLPPGKVTVSAMHPTLTLNSHSLKVRAGALNTTVVVPP